MASKAVHDAVIALIEGAWGNTTPIIKPNQEGETPTDGGAFLTIQFPVATEEHIGMAAVGNRTFRENGAIRLVLSTPRGEGIDQALTRIETLRNALRANDSVPHLKLLFPSPAFLDDGNDSGSYFVLSSVCEYYFDNFA